MTKHEKAGDGFFDHFAAEDRPTRFGAWLVKALAAKTFKYAAVPAGGSILEIGPGRGEFADICIGKGLEYWAVEPNAQLAALLEKKGAKVVRAKVPPLPALGRRFDLVVMINVMEHMDTMQAALELSRQIRQVLKPGGKFIIHSPDYLNWRLNFFNCDFSHNFVTTRRRLDQLLINAGFTNIKSSFLCATVSGPLAVLLSIPAGLKPFGWLEAMFPQNKVIHKLYKLQLSFLRNVLIAGERARNE